MTDEEKDYLIENNILVESSVNEYEDYLQKFEEWKTSEKELTITLGMTFQCNFDCKYCIQKGNYSERDTIDRNKADQIIRWTEEALKGFYNFKTLNINYFGGEPTLNLENIFYLSERLAELCIKRNITFYQQIVTNGYALDQNSIRRMKALGIRDYQITLDGLAEVHNSRRSRNFDSFSQIVHNIILIAEMGMRIFLLHVFDLSNIESAKELVDYFNKLAEKRPKLRDAITFNFVPTIPKQVDCVECNHYVEGNEHLLSGLAVEAFAYAVEKGFHMANFLDIGHCFRQAKNTLLVSPVLDLYKCYGTFGNPSYAIGNMDDITYEEYIKASELIREADGFSSQCRECDVVPFCRGGCQFSSSEMNNGKYGRMWCERNTILKSIQGFMRYKLLS